MWKVTTPLGRVIIAGWTAMPRVEDAVAYHKAVMEAVGKLKRPVICADWSQGKVMAPDVAAEMLAMLAGANAHIERVAILLAPERAIFTMQAERLVRDAKSTDRHTFRDRAELVAWVGNVLTSAELHVVREHFLPPGHEPSA